MLELPFQSQSISDLTFIGSFYFVCIVVRVRDFQERNVLLYIYLYSYNSYSKEVYTVMRKLQEKPWQEP